MNKFIRCFSEIGIDDIPEVGGKNALLGELCRELAGEGIVVPDGLAITADAYRTFLRKAGLEAKIAQFEKIASGPARVIKNAQFLGQFKPGEIFVTDKTDPDWEPIMMIAAAILTNRGGRTCHAAIVSRELGAPAIVGKEHGTDKLRDGQIVTVSCAEGDTGFVFTVAIARKEASLQLEATHELEPAGTGLRY